MLIDQKTMAEIVQLGGQYFLPIAALLRALYSGIRGKFPEGFAQIAVGSFLAGLTAIVGHNNLDLRSIILTVFSNTVFVAGLLAFTMTYLLRMRNRGMTLDAIVGGIIGLITYGLWIYVLQNPWPWYTAPLFIAGGAAGFVVLRILLRQIYKLVRIATYLIVGGLILVLGAGGIMLLQTVLVQYAAK